MRQLSVDRKLIQELRAASAVRNSLHRGILLRRIFLVCTLPVQRAIRNRTREFAFANSFRVPQKVR